MTIHLSLGVGKIFTQLGQLKNTESVVKALSWKARKKSKHFPLKDRKYINLDMLENVAQSHSCIIKV